MGAVASSSSSGSQTLLPDNHPLLQYLTSEFNRVCKNHPQEQHVKPISKPENPLKSNSSSPTSTSSSNQDDEEDEIDEENKARGAAKANLESISSSSEPTSSEPTTVEYFPTINFLEVSIFKTSIFSFSFNQFVLQNHMK